MWGQRAAPMQTVLSPESSMARCSCQDVPRYMPGSVMPCGGPNDCLLIIPYICATLYVAAPASDGGSGFIPETFTVSQAAMYGGTPCNFANNTAR
jgi:hypothetical protein